jgi:hypothetical protein
MHSRIRVIALVLIHQREQWRRQRVAGRKAGGVTQLLLREQVCALTINNNTDRVKRSTANDTAAQMKGRKAMANATDRVSARGYATSFFTDTTWRGRVNVHVDLASAPPLASVQEKTLNYKTFTRSAQSMRLLRARSASEEAS